MLFAVWSERAVAARRISELEPEAAAKAALQVERDKLASAYKSLRTRVQGVIDADAEKANVLAQVKQAAEAFNAQLAAAKVKYVAIKQNREQEVQVLELALVPLRAEHRALSEEALLREMGYYKSHYLFATSEKYKKAIDDNDKKKREMLAAKAAARCTRPWRSDEKGKQVDKTLALMLRAFNGECDSAIAKIGATNFQAMENRIIKSFEAINKLGGVHGCQIVEQYKNLRLAELHLEYELALKVRYEREEQKAIKDEMRQQALAEKELERAQQEAEREERQYQVALDKAREEFERASAPKQEEMKARLAELENMVAEAHANKDRAISRAQQTRSGHVYVISNIGAFGTNIYKIGMTRRLDPMDRVWELSALPVF